MPEESLKERVTQRTEGSGQLELDQLEDIAREFDVSTEALVYRIASIFYLKKEDSRKMVEAVKKLAGYRKSNQPETLPVRYCDLAQRALREGKLSLMQFAKYMDISYKKAPHRWVVRNHIIAFVSEAKWINPSRFVGLEVVEGYLPSNFVAHLDKMFSPVSSYEVFRAFLCNVA